VLAPDWLEAVGADDVASAAADAAGTPGSAAALQPGGLEPPCPSCGFGHQSDLDHQAGFGDGSDGGAVSGLGDGDGGIDLSTPQESGPTTIFPTSTYVREGTGSTGTDALVGGAYKWGGALGT